jgi:hypothetical protein
MAAYPGGIVHAMGNRACGKIMATSTKSLIEDLDSQDSKSNRSNLFFGAFLDVLQWPRMSQRIDEYMAHHVLVRLLNYAFSLASKFWTQTSELARLGPYPMTHSGSKKNELPTEAA